MNNFFNGKIYRLYSDNCKKFYIGSTTVSLEERFERHNTSYEEWLTSNFKSGYISAFEILKHGDCKMKLIEESAKISGYELVNREQYYQIINYKDIVNILIAGKYPKKKYKLTDTNEIYTCSCGANILNCYRIRKNHSMTNIHRKKIREIHLQMVSNNPDYEIIEEQTEEILFEKEGQTLNIYY